MLELCRLSVLVWTLTGFLAAAAVQDCVVLPPRQPRMSEVIKLGYDETRYKLVGLRPNTGYEVRVSYPATVRSSIALQLALSSYTFVAPLACLPLHLNSRVWGTTAGPSW